jgi:hypothetical protein
MKCAETVLGVEDENAPRGEVEGGLEKRFPDESVFPD